MWRRRLVRFCPYPGGRVYWPCLSSFNKDVSSMALAEGMDHGFYRRLGMRVFIEWQRTYRSTINTRLPLPEPAVSVIQSPCEHGLDGAVFQHNVQIPGISLGHSTIPSRNVGQQVFVSNIKLCGENFQT